MLLRTTYKYKLAFVIRTSLFLIPIIYFSFFNHNVLKHNDYTSQKVRSLRLADDTEYRSRRLLGVRNGQKNCTSAAILEFPPDGLNRTQRKQGFIAIHCIFAMCCFLLLGTVCEKYFVPAIKLICEKINMAEDVAGATFMAAASSSPELFINCVGTFITEGDLGVGAVVGSAVFNVLAVPACCGLLAAKVIDLDWWSVSRDCLMYSVAVVSLIFTLQDDKVYWYEALYLVMAYTFYILAMYFNEGLGRYFKSGCCVKKRPKMYTEVTPLLTKDKLTALDLQNKLNNNVKNGDIEEGIELIRKYSESDSDTTVESIWSWPGEKETVLKKLKWTVMWPINLVLWLTIPDCTRYRRLYPLTFAMCIFWIAGVSYLVAWLITVIGDTLEIPDSITGLTILAAGTSLPEAVSSVVVTNQGHGSMGISNSIGSNTFDILLCLGLPWLIKSVWYPTVPGNHWVAINSSGLSYSAVALLSTLFALYLALLFNKFKLDWRTGVVCIVVYLAFIMLAILIELNVFFPVNLPVCPHF